MNTSRRATIINVSDTDWIRTVGTTITCPPPHITFWPYPNKIIKKKIIKKKSKKNIKLTIKKKKKNKSYPNYDHLPIDVQEIIAGIVAEEAKIYFTEVITIV
tara:strand:+ start:1285 stop:1590 length:306 start_codon:yes stop_codon:yes gene_type:complete